MEGASLNDDEIKRIEDALAKVHASVEKIGYHMQNIGPDFAKMPNPLPVVANELLGTMTALKNYRDDYARGLKSLDQLRAETAELKRKNEDKKKSLQKRDESLQKRDEDLTNRERELEKRTVRQDTLAALLDRREADFNSQILVHSENVKAHHEQVGRDKVHREDLDKREKNLKESKYRLDNWETQLRVQDKDQQVRRARLDGREESITSTQKKLDNDLSSLTAELNSLRWADEPSHRTSAEGTTPQTPIIVSPSQKRKLVSAHSGSHKRLTSSHGQASRPGSISSENEEPPGTTLSFGEPLNADIARGDEQPQTPREAVAQPTQAIQKQPVVMQQPTTVDHIWSQLMFSPPAWAVEDQTRLQRELRHHQDGPEAYRPLVLFEKMARRQAKGDELCWISQSLKTKGDFTTGGNSRPCENCRRLRRLCLRIEHAPAQSGSTYLVTKRL